MREIKFRVFDNGVMDYEPHMHEFEDINGQFENMTYDDMSFMQYTGLKDKEGVEIYEGDIVEYGTSNSKAFYAECIFENAKFQWKIHDTHDTYNDYDILAEDEGNWIEIIGNIYENPELLETK